MNRQISVEDWKKMDPEQTVLVDVREETQTQFGTIEGALYIPATSLHKLYELPKDKRIVVFCQKGETSHEVVEVLLDAGYDAYEMQGGYLAYLASL